MKNTVILQKKKLMLKTATWVIRNFIAYGIVWQRYFLTLSYTPSYKLLQSYELFKLQLEGIL